MKFGVMAPCSEPFAHDPSIYGRVASKAEELGYESLCVTNHFLKPSAEVKHESVRSHTTLETWTLLGYLASKTEKVKLASCVTPLPLYNPLILAKVVSTVDNLSNGRVIFGVGAGYERPEFEAYGSWEPASVRVARTAEALELMKRLWTEGIVNFEGKFYRTKNAVLEPKPAQKPHPIIATGAMRDRMFRITAQHADLWLPSRSLGATLEFYVTASKKMVSLAKEFDRKVTLGLIGGITEEGLASSGPSIGTIKNCAKVLEQYGALGCDYFAASFSPIEKVTQLMERFHREIVPSFT